MGCHDVGLASTIIPFSNFYSLPGSAAEAAAARKRSKYAAITLTHMFVPVAVETLGPLNAEGLVFWIKLATGSLPLPETYASRPSYIKGYLCSFNVLT